MRLVYLQVSHHPKYLKSLLLFSPYFKEKASELDMSRKCDSSLSPPKEGMIVIQGTTALSRAGHLSTQLAINFPTHWDVGEGNSKKTKFVALLLPT